MTLKKILVRIYFPDDTDELVIEVSKGFHCMFIPISDIKNLIKRSL